MIVYNTHYKCAYVVFGWKWSPNSSMLIIQNVFRSKLSFVKSIPGSSRQRRTRSLWPWTDFGWVFKIFDIARRPRYFRFWKRRKFSLNRRKFFKLKMLPTYVNHEKHELILALFCTNCGNWRICSRVARLLTQYTTTGTNVPNFHSITKWP
jgi:hypothetical protein